MAKKPIKRTEEEILENKINMLKESHSYKNPSLVPTRKFEVGEKVEIGLLSQATVNSIYDDKIYIIKHFVKPRDEKARFELSPFLWTEILPYREREAVLSIARFGQQEKIVMSRMTTDISSLIHRHLRFGVDFSPNYQRDYVWDNHDKDFLLDSIFNNINIGLFVFRKLPWAKSEFGYEIVDGKQRLSFLIDFYLDKYAYNGLKFSEMTTYDQNHFLDYSINAVDVSEDTPEIDILELFVRLNTTGRPIPSEHLDSVREKIKELKGA